jgi:hypothetical protein
LPVVVFVVVFVVDFVVSADGWKGRRLLGERRRTILRDQPVQIVLGEMNGGEVIP